MPIPKSGPARLPDADSSARRTHPSVVPGTTVLLTTTTWYLERSRSTWPTCSEARRTAVRSMVAPSNGVPTAMKVRSDRRTASARSVVALRRRPTFRVSSSSRPSSNIGDRAAFNAAKLLQRTGRTNDAIAHFRKVVEIEPAFGTGHLYLAQALLEAGDLDGAEQWARSGLERDPEPRLAPLGHYVLADVYEQRGRMTDAKREIAAAERLKRARQP